VWKYYRTLKNKTLNLNFYLDKFEYDQIIFWALNNDEQYTDILFFRYIYIIQTTDIDMNVK